MTSRSFATPLEAEAAFYAAFVKRDLNAMMAVWAEDADIVCVHPLGTLLTGIAAVQAAWEAIFRSGQEIKFVIEERHRSQGPSLALHCVLEHMRIGGKTQPPMAATNAYRLTDSGWRMVLHHASPAPESDADVKPLQTFH
jgi:ketosteroid isomerase-like protein